MEQNNGFSKKPGAFAGYLIGLGFALLMAVVFKFGEIKSLAEELFAPKYETAEELISHGLLHMEEGESIPYFYTYEHYANPTDKKPDDATYLKLGYPKDGGYPLLTGLSNKAVVEKLAVRPYRGDTEKLRILLTGLSIRDNTRYQIEDYSGKYSCYLFDFSITKEDFHALCDVPYFTEDIMEETIGDNPAGNAYAAIDSFGYIRTICFETEDTVYTIGFQK